MAKSKKKSKKKKNVSERLNFAWCPPMWQVDLSKSSNVYNLAKDIESILEEAQRYTTSDRATTHGSSDDNFKRTSEILEAWWGIKLPPQDVPKVMMCLKMARMYHNPQNRDNHVDLVGYAKLHYQMLDQDLSDFQVESEMTGR